MDLSTTLHGIAAETARRAARAYLDRHGLSADPIALQECLVSHITIAWPGACRDAQEACDAILGKDGERIGIQTFGASMALAGIEAAKEAGLPRKGVA